MTFPCLNTVTRSLIGQHNGEFMGDEGDDGQIVAGHGFDGCQQFLCFRRGQGGGRFIQDEDFRPTIERFEDFDDLLFAFGKLPDFGFEVDFEAIFVAEFVDFFCQPVSNPECPRPADGPG